MRMMRSLAGWMLTTLALAGLSAFEGVERAGELWTKRKEGAA